MSVFASPPVAGGIGIVGGVVRIAGPVIILFVLMVIGAFAYRTLSGGGARRSDENADKPPDDEDVARGDDDEEWDYY